MKLTDVRVVAAPRDTADWEAPAAERRAQAAKQAAVAAAELDKLRLASNSGGGSMGTWIVGALVEALQLEVSRVHVCFQELLSLEASEEDDTSASGEARRPAALGVCVEQLTLRAASTEDGVSDGGAASAPQPQPQPGGAAQQGVTHKVVRVTGLSAYVDPGSRAETGAHASRVEHTTDDTFHILAPLDVTLNVRLHRRAPGATAAPPVDAANEAPHAPHSPPGGAALFITATRCAAPQITVTYRQVGTLARVADALDVWAMRNKHAVHRPQSWRNIGGAASGCVSFGAVPRDRAAGAAPMRRDRGAVGRPPGWAADGWRYAFAAVRSSLRAARRWTSRQELLARRNMRLAYVRATAARLDGTDLPADGSHGTLAKMVNASSSSSHENDPATVLETLEAELSVSDILLFRTIAQRHVASTRSGPSRTARISSSQQPSASTSSLAAESSAGSVHSATAMNGVPDAIDASMDEEDEEDVPHAQSSSAVLAPPTAVLLPKGGRRQQRRGWVRSGVAYVLGSLPLVDARRRFPSLLAPEEHEWRDELLAALEATAEGGNEHVALPPGSSPAIHVHIDLLGLNLRLTCSDAACMALAQHVDVSVGSVAVRVEICGAVTTAKLRVAALRIALLEGDVSGAASMRAPDANTLCAASGTSEAPMLSVEVTIQPATALILRAAMRELTLAHAPHHGRALASCGDAVARFLPLEGASLLEHKVASACGLESQAARDSAREQLAALFGKPWIIEALAVEDSALFVGSSYALDAAWRRWLRPHRAAPGVNTWDAFLDVAVPLSPVREAEDAESPEAPGTPPAREEGPDDGTAAAASGLGLDTAPRDTGDCSSPCCVAVRVARVAISTPEVEASAATLAQSCYTRLNIVIGDVAVCVECPAALPQSEGAHPAVSVPIAELPSLNASLALFRLPRDTECVTIRAALKAGALAARVSPASAQLLRSVFDAFTTRSTEAATDSQPQQPHRPLFADVSFSMAAVSLELLPSTQDGYWQTWSADGLSLAASRTAADGAVLTASVARCRADGAPAGGRAPAVQLARFLPSVVVEDDSWSATQMHASQTPALLSIRVTSVGNSAAPSSTARCHVDGLDTALSWGALASMTDLADAYATPWRLDCSKSDNPRDLHVESCTRIALLATAASEHHSLWSRAAQLITAHGDDTVGVTFAPHHRTLSGGGVVATAARRVPPLPLQRPVRHRSHLSTETSSSGMSTSSSDEDEGDGTDVWEDAASAWGTESELSEADRHSVHLAHASTLGVGAHESATHVQHRVTKAATQQQQAASVQRVQDAEAKELHSHWLRLGFIHASAPAISGTSTLPPYAADAASGDMPLYVFASASALRLRLLTDDNITGSATLASARVAALRIRGHLDLSRVPRFNLALDTNGMTLTDESGWRPVTVVGGREASCPLTVTLRARSDDAISAGGSLGVRVTAAVRSVRAVLVMDTVQSLLMWAQTRTAVPPTAQQQTAAPSRAAPRAIQVHLECELDDALVVVPEPNAPSGSEPRCALLVVPHLAAASAPNRQSITVQGITFTAAQSERVAADADPVCAIPRLAVAVDASAPGAAAASVSVPQAVVISLSPRRVAFLALIANQLAARLSAVSASSAGALRSPPKHTSHRAVPPMSVQVDVAAMDVHLRGEPSRGASAPCEGLSRLHLRGLTAHATIAPDTEECGRGHVAWDELTLSEHARSKAAASIPLFSLRLSQEAMTSGTSKLATMPRVEVTWGPAAPASVTRVGIKLFLSGGAIEADVPAWQRLIASAVACAPTAPNVSLSASAGPGVSGNSEVTPQRGATFSAKAQLRDASAHNMFTPPPPKTTGGVAAVVVAASANHAAVTLSPMQDALATVCHAVPSLSGGEGLVASGQHEHHSERVDQPAVPQHVPTQQRSASLPAPAAPRMAVSALPLQIALCVDAPEWNIVLPDAWHLRCGITVDASSTAMHATEEMVWSVDARCAHLVVSLLDQPASNAPPAAIAPALASSQAAAATPLRTLGSVAPDSGGHWALPPQGSERSLSFGSLGSADAPPSPRHSDSDASALADSRAARAVPVLQLDGLAVKAQHTRAASTTGGDEAAHDGIHVVTRASAVSIWVSPRRLRLLSHMSQHPDGLSGSMQSTALHSGRSTNREVPQSLAEPLSITLHLASVAALLSDDRAGVTVPIIEAALLDLSLDASMRPLVASKSHGPSSGRASGVRHALIEGVGRTTALVDYYNTDIAAWEPLLEPWRCTIRGGVAPAAAVSPMGPQLRRGHIAVSSPERIELTLSRPGSDALAAAKDALMIASGGVVDGDIHSHSSDASADGSAVYPPGGAAGERQVMASPYWLHNVSGVPLRYMLVAADAATCGTPSASPQLEVAFRGGQASGEAGIVQPGQRVPLFVAGATGGMDADGRYVRPHASPSSLCEDPASDMHAGGTPPSPLPSTSIALPHGASLPAAPAYKCVRFALEGSSWFSRGIALSALGARHFDARVGSTRAKAVCDVARRDGGRGGRILRVRSDVAVRNTTATALDVHVQSSRPGSSDARPSNPVAADDAQALAPHLRLAPGERAWLPLLSTDGVAPSLRCAPVQPTIGSAASALHTPVYSWSDAVPVRHLLDAARASPTPLGPVTAPGAVVACPVSKDSPCDGTPFWLCLDSSPVVADAHQSRRGSRGSSHGLSTAGITVIGIELRVRPPLDVLNALPVSAELCVRGPGAGGGPGGTDTMLAPFSRCCLHTLDPSSAARLFFRPDGFSRGNPVALPTAPELVQQAVAHGYEDDSEGAASPQGLPAALASALPPRLFEVMPTSQGRNNVQGASAGGVTLGVTAWPAGGAARAAVLRARLVVYNHTRLPLVAEPVTTSLAAGHDSASWSALTASPGDTPSHIARNNVAGSVGTPGMYDVSHATGWRRGRGRLLPPAAQGEANAARSRGSDNSSQPQRPAAPPPAGLRVLTSTGRHSLQATSRLGLAVVAAGGSEPHIWHSPANSMADLLALPEHGTAHSAGGHSESLLDGAQHMGATPVLLGSEADWLPGAPPLRLRFQAAPPSGSSSSFGTSSSSIGEPFAASSLLGGGVPAAASPSAWSKTFGVDAVDSATASHTQTVLTPSGCGAYALVVTRSGSGGGGLPTPGHSPSWMAAMSVVHIRPRCTLRNGLACALRVRVVTPTASASAPGSQFGQTLVLAPGAWCEIHPVADPAAGAAAAPSSLLWPSSTGGNVPGALVSLRYAEGGWDWSGALPLDTPGETLLRLRHPGRGASHVLRIDVRESRRAPGTWTAAVVASSAASGASSAAAGASFMPFRLENFTGVTLRFRQRINSVNSKASLAASASMSSLPDTDAVPPYNAAEFAWDEPTQPRALVLEAPPDKGGVLGTFGLDTVGFVAALHPRGRGRGAPPLLVRVSADGPTRVLSVIDTALHPAELVMVPPDVAPDESQLAAAGASPGGASPSVLLPVVPFAGELLSVGVDIGGVALSLVGPTEELLYACLSGITLHAARSALDVTLHATAVRVQVDNQLRGTTSPVMLSCGGLPAPIHSTPRSGGPHADGDATPELSWLAPSAAEALMLPRRPGPAVGLRFARWRRRANGVVCVRELVLDVSPLALDLDDQLVEALPGFIHSLAEPHVMVVTASRTHGTASDDGDAADASSNVHAFGSDGSDLDGVVFPTSADGGSAAASVETKVYIERLQVSPLRIRLTARRLPFLPHGVKVLTSIEGAALTVAGLRLCHPLLPTRELAAHAVRHYQRQARAAATTLVGSVSLLGDPVGLAAALRRAAWRLVHGAEPDDDSNYEVDPEALGDVVRPHPLTARGLAHGAAASSSGARRFASDLVVALTDALRKSSGAIRVVALRAAVELEARVQRRAAQQLQLQLASASVARDDAAASRQHSANRRRASTGRSASLGTNSTGGDSYSTSGPVTPQQVPHHMRLDDRGGAAAGGVGDIISGGSGAASAMGGSHAGGVQPPDGDGDALDAVADADVLSALAHGLAALLAGPFVGLETRGLVGALEGALLGVGAALARPAASAAAVALRCATAARDAAAHGVAAQPPAVSRLRPPRVVPPSPQPLPRYSAQHAAGAAILRAAAAAAAGGGAHRGSHSGAPTPLGRLPALPFRGAWALVSYTQHSDAQQVVTVAAQGAYLVLTPRHALVGCPPPKPGAHEWLVPWASPLTCVVACAVVAPGVCRLLLVPPVHVRIDTDATAAQRWRRAMAALEGKEQQQQRFALTPGGAAMTAERRDAVDDDASLGSLDGVLMAPRHSYRVVPPSTPWTSLTLHFADEGAAIAAAAAVEHRVHAASEHGRGGIATRHGALVEMLSGFGLE